MPVFAHPWAWTLVLPALWLLWRARRPRPRDTFVVANLFLWRRSATATAASSIEDRRLPPLRVWLQVAVLTLIAAATTQPSTPVADADEALIVDASESMTARDGDSTRLAQAQADALAWMAAQPSGRRVHIVAAGERVTDLGTVRSGDSRVADVIRGLRAGGGTADFSRAIGAARQHTLGRITVISDLPAPVAAADLAWRQIGQPLDNTALTAVERIGDTAIVEVANFGRASIRASLVVSAGATWSRALLLNAGTQQAFVVPVTQAAESITAELQVNRDDAVHNALASDDRRTSTGAPTSPLRVLLVSPGSAALEAAIRALPDVTLITAPTLPPRPHDAADVIICDRCAEPAPAPSMWIPSVSATPDTAGVVTVARPDHPVLHAVDLSDLRLSAVPKGPHAAQETPLATVAGAPIISASEVDGARLVTLAVDLEPSALTLSPAFPILMFNAIHWLGQRATPSLDPARVLANVESNLLSPPPARLEGGDVAGPRAPSSPWWPALATLAAGVALLELALRQRTVALRVLAVSALVAALAGLRAPWAAERHVVFAIDTSASVSAVRRAAVARVDGELRLLPATDRASIVAFGAGAREVRGVTPGLSVASLLPEPSAGTDIATGLRSARALLGSTGDRRIVLMTDGQVTAGDVVAEAAATARAGVPIDVIPLRTSHQPVLTRLDAPTDARMGGSIAIAAHLSGQPGMRLSVRLDRDDVEIASRVVTLDAAGAGRIDFIDAPTKPGLAFYRAAIVDDQLGIALSESGAAVAVSGRGRALVVSHRPGRFSSMGRGGSLDLVDVPAAQLPSTRAALSAYSAVVLDGIAPTALSLQQSRALAEAVTLDGLGILLIGSRNSLESSDFAPSPFVDLLPLDFTQLPRPPSSTAALALLVDLSGSMATTSDGVTKIDAARDAIRRALAVVPTTDAVEVIGFSTSPSVVVGPTDARSGESLMARLQALRPSGGTAIAPAIVQAVAWLSTTQTPRRRLLLVSDGRTTPSDAAAVKAAVDGRAIEVSVVTIGADAERAWLAELAASTGGRAYFPEALRDLARDVAREAARGASEREVTGRIRVRSGTHALAPEASSPEVGGYVAARVRVGAASAWLSPSDDTLLAAWTRGLGRVAALASDIEGAWGAPLDQWSEARRYWPRALGWVARNSDRATLDAELTTTTSGARLVVDLGGPVTGDGLPEVSAAVITPSGRTLTLPLHPVTPTRYEAALDLDETGNYRATLAATEGAGGAERRSTRGWYWNGDVESRAVGVNESLLADLARISDGRLLPAVPDAWQAADAVSALPHARSSSVLTVWLLLLSAILFAIDYVRAMPGQRTV